MAKPRYWGSKEGKARLLGPAREALEEEGYDFVEEPTDLRTPVWTVEHQGKRKKLLMKTAADRWITANHDSNGSWPVLEDVDEVAVAALDDRESPTKVEIYRFPADEVRARLSENFRARQANGMSDQKTDWAHIDPSSSDKPSYAGSGLGAQYPAIASFSLTGHGSEPEPPPSDPIASGTVAQVIETARQQIAGITGLTKAAVQIEVRLNPSE